MNYLKWFEPRPGLLSDGTEVPVTLTITASREDCIAMARKALQKHGPVDDETCLAEFIYIHFAEEARK